jgi:hypothetical protein
MKSHTPGPWLAMQNEAKADLYIYAKQDKTGQEIASIPWTPVNAVNARLIAAAPELASKLSELLGVIFSEELAGHFKHETLKDVSDLVARATGGDS